MGLLFKRTKILATIGPATNTKEAIHELVHAGVNGFRLNFSHGSYEERDQQIEWIRSYPLKPIAILQDLQGPKIPLGNLKDNVLVAEGDELTLEYDIEHDGKFHLPVQYNLAEKVKVGETIYIFDGKVR
ncbi:MAG: pyruvate kinase, partial [Candidatus Saccharibacteria bacterium]|nr:pyruvate kinase [Candidatus Saccharibacteria bacterium]